MKVDIEVGMDRLGVDVPEANVIMAARAESPAPPVADIGAAVRAALDEPLRFPPLRQALTPDDHVTIVLDDHLPTRPEIVTPLLEHLAVAQVGPAAITLLCANEGAKTRWQAVLPEPAARLEVHDPRDRKQQSYLATTSGGRRIYLARAVVEADQLVVLTRLGYDPLLGYAGAEAAIYPALSDEATRTELSDGLSMAAADEVDWPVREEAAEVAWLLGAPFFVQLIDGSGDSFAHVVGGNLESSEDAEGLLDARWRVVLPQSADTVVASLSGDPTRHDFRDLARALACAARVVKPDGHIVLLSRAGGVLGPGADLLRQFDEPEAALAALREQGPPDLSAAFLWANAVQQARVYLMSALPAEVAEELFVTPMEDALQVQRLLAGSGTCVFLPDAHKTLAVVE